METSKRIEQLEWQIKSLADKQNFFNQSISKLQAELNRLKLELSTSDSVEKVGKPIAQEKKITETLQPISSVEPQKIPIQKPRVKPKKARKDSQSIERFIGKNLMVIVGIVVLVLGLAFGVKYSIDHDLISEKGRIFLAYLASLSLIGVAMKLRKKFESFSAVLLSGACCSLYFTTFVAYDTYSFIGREVAFALMLLFTIFTVLASLSYNKSIIAHLGLLGAYAIPFLTSQNSGNYPGLMLFIALVNLGILFLSFKKDWKSLKIVSFVLTWVIFVFSVFGGFIDDYWRSAFFHAGLIFVMFFAIILAYKFIKKKSLNVLDVILVLVNNVIFYMYGMLILGSQDLMDFRGLFTIFVGLLNFIPAYKIFRDKNRSDNLIHFLGTIVLTFLTIAIPVQLDGHWVTLFWMLEGILLLWVSKRNGVQFMQILGFILVLISFFSFLDDISNAQLAYKEIFRPVLNLNFLGGFIYCGLLLVGLMFFFKKEQTVFSKNPDFLNITGYFVAALSVISFLILGMNEIYSATQFYWRSTSLDIPDRGTQFDTSIRKIGTISHWIYFTLIVGGIYFLSRAYKRTKELNIVHLSLSVITILIFLTVCLPTLESLGLMYYKSTNEYFSHGFGLFFMRYAIIGLAMFFARHIYLTIKKYYQNQGLEKVSDIILYGALFITLAYELIFWMKVYSVPEPYKLGVSILAAIYTIYLIIRGIFAKKAHLRYFGFAILGCVLLKLFFYDIAHLKTLSKTIILMSIGVCMLISSFLYNKYTQKMLDDE